jgi:hypothetical protein
MADDVTTRLETREPWVYVEVRNGRFGIVQFRDTPDHQHVEVLEALRVALSRALRQHGRDVVDRLTGPRRSTDPDRDAALRFVDERLDAADGTVPMPQTDWFAGLADGRDPSGLFHVAVAGDQVVIAEAPVGFLADARAAGEAARSALNQALERIERDYAPYVGQPSAVPAIDWSAEALTFRRIRQGY